MAFGTDGNVLTDSPIVFSNSTLLSYEANPRKNGSIRGGAKQASCSKDELAYNDWMVNHPSALDMFEKMMAESKGKQIVVFLDYDGTLSPIVDDPDKAYMDSKMRAAVRNVAKYFPTAIISGRGLDKVYDFVQLTELYYAGSHGMDIMGPTTNSGGSKASYRKTKDKKGDYVLYQPASEFLPMMDKIFSSLVEKMRTIDGAKVENNKFCVSVHYRCVQQKSWNALEEQIQSVIRDYPGFRLTGGKMVVEIRPPIIWDKGKALEFLLEKLGLANCNDVLPVYIGDDRTDEDAFKVLQTRGQGYGILVSTTPKETSANFSLKDPTQVMNFLNRLAKWKPHSKGVRFSRV